MKNRLIVICAMASAAAQYGHAQVPPPPVPANIQAPAGHVPYLQAEASGTQNQVCVAAASGYSWKFIGPQATLFLNIKMFQNTIKQQITTHYLSPNPDENGVARATWQSSTDTSAVWAKSIASSTDPNYVAPGAIPWLLLEVTGRTSGLTGGGLLVDTSYIQRVNTAGGVPEPRGCNNPSDIGAIQLVPYTTTYIFYKPAGRN